MSVHEKMTAIADAIRSKTGSTGALTLDQMAAEISGMTAGGSNDDTLIALLSRTVTEITLPEAATTLGIGAFKACTGLTALDLRNVTKLGNECFYDCTSLALVSGPEVTTLNSNSFRNCKKLVDLNFPKATALSSNCFYGCSSLQSVSFPKVTSCSTGVFQNCTGLAVADFSVLRTIPATMFSSCALLTKLVLRHSGVVTLSNVSAFTGTPFASGGSGGQVYVPSAYISSYKTATNWSTLYNAGSCTFVAIEGSAFD